MCANVYALLEGYLDSVFFFHFAYMNADGVGCRAALLATCVECGRE